VFHKPRLSPSANILAPIQKGFMAVQCSQTQQMEYYYCLLAWQPCVLWYRWHFTMWLDNWRTCLSITPECPPAYYNVLTNKPTRFNDFTHKLRF